MFLSSETGHRLEPVSVVSGTVFYRPFFHGNGYRVSYVQLQMSSIFDCFAKGFIHILRQFVTHYLIVKNKASI